jgi:hypothetical protein
MKPRHEALVALLFRSVSLVDYRLMMLLIDAFVKTCSGKCCDKVAVHVTRTWHASHSFFLRPLRLTPAATLAHVAALL